MKNKLLCILLIIIFISLFLSSDEIIDSYMKNARTSYIFKDYAGSYQYVNFVLKAYKSKTTPNHVYLLAEKIYYNYLLELLNNDDRTKINEMSKNLLEFNRARGGI